MFTGIAEKERSLTLVHSSHDLVIVGGGMTGVCCAITAARQGVDVALIQDRPVLGGNASSEVRLWVLGATSHMGNNNRWSREGGVIDEILVENTYRNKEGNPVLFDMVLMDKVLAESNITLYLNTFVYEIDKTDQRNIATVTAFNPQNGTNYIIAGKLFAECSGDGILGYLSGASFRMGAEDRNEFGEGFAPNKVTYGELLGHSILFYVKDTGKPVSFTAPEFALKSAEKHIPKLHNPEYFNTAQHGCKYWWLEYGGRLDTIKDTEKIKFELWKVVYGVWDYVKNSGKFPETVNQTLEWVGLFPGKRESRRFNGHYMLTQQDVIEQREHYDAVSYGGWSIDLHPADGVYSEGKGCNQWHSKGIYQIPYRCYVTPEIDNLFIGGRVISASHVANGSTRVMCTAAHGGQVIGMASSLLLAGVLNKPSDLIAPQNITKLQKKLIQTGHFIPGVVLENDTLGDWSEIYVSSQLRLSELSHDNSWFRMDYPAAQLIPVDGRMPVVEVQVKAQKQTVLRVELRSSSKAYNYTPDTVDKTELFQLEKGENKIVIDFGHTYDYPRYVFICFMTNPDVMLPLSGDIVSGVMSVFNYVNPAVSNYGKQTPKKDIGVEEFEFWCPQRRPEGKNLSLRFDPPLDSFGGENLRSEYFRPFLKPNGWIPSPEDTKPYAQFNLDNKREITKVTLFFDTDFDHAMENVQMGHHDSVMPQCIRAYRLEDDKGKTIFQKTDNHQSCNMIVLPVPLTSDYIRFYLVDNEKGKRKALMGMVIE